MSEVDTIAVIPHQDQIDIDIYESAVMLTQVNSDGNEDDTILVAESNLPILIEALQRAHAVLKDGHAATTSNSTEQG